MSQTYPLPLPLPICEVTLGNCLSFLTLKTIVNLPPVSKSFYAAFYSPTPNTNILHPKQVIELAFRPRKSLTSKATGESWYRLLNEYQCMGNDEKGNEKENEKENEEEVVVVEKKRKKRKVVVDAPEGHVKCTCGVIEDMDLSIDRNGEWITDDKGYDNEVKRRSKMANYDLPPKQTCKFNMPMEPLPDEYFIFGGSCGECGFEVNRVYGKCRDCGPWCTKIGPNFLTEMCKVDGCWRGVTCGSHAGNLCECDKCGGRVCGSKCLEEMGREMWCVDCYDEYVGEEEEEGSEEGEGEWVGEDRGNFMIADVGEEDEDEKEFDDDEDEGGEEGWGGNEFEEDY
ncbi:hypothetical protein TL16_g01375 [Triparma laevis f. inornata]|uniref:Uncharacterized protein n=2 Tax=Triparma laevis TaxID=1534972 RepID=A0A9W7DSU6_9STRA|nr:hypothetical protein TL16_g01375 [Triparma laevis f. inornata]GMH53552.1 hypothetical protein TrLO_g205 [Triparma laevis f. longispina]